LQSQSAVGESGDGFIEILIEQLGIENCMAVVLQPSRLDATDYRNYSLGESNPSRISRKIKG